ncbi:MAG: hypothetical protein ACR2HN_02925, partial [Tepidiformaceae bacterium]
DRMGVKRGRARVFLFSDFFAGDGVWRWWAAARRHDIIAVRIREPMDEALPNAGIVTIADSETGRLVEVDSGHAATREAYAAHARNLDLDRRHLFGELGIDEIRVTVGKDYVPALLQFFKRRALSVAS